MEVTDLYSDAIVLSGPSGVGKSTLCKRLLAAHPGVFAMAVSHTTREPRPGEVHGVSYYYISQDEFARLIGADAFIEHAEFNGNLYGTSKQTVVDQAAKGDVDYRFIFVRPPDFATLESHLRGRGTEDEASVQRRLARARDEIAYAETPGVHDKIIVNNDLDAAYKELHDFVIRKADHGGKDA
ncbi:guanylate kinase [Sporothrix schenckii 1099-18]|uniref:Guanylate kinase-like domain-containing protein n=2 Tax=Sporothrix schenckii TaxID=29908 RepID=U7Q3N2_SPOS1|nr:guanylate kinase [Sporothrix schenckii 1099-18]ERT02428.1 hypothetical protein HMPREF1624_00726 [Sporothrix schenckii ATCC 58251]KJR80302.1 guanylate kinase [Sporothrix schenckii 1099-18]